MIDISAVFANYTGTFPNFKGKNASGAGATDGTEFIAAMIDNWMWGSQQALFDYVNITPNGVTEAAGASQVVDALNKIGVPVGCIVEWNRANDPVTDNFRYLFLNGQGILRANYADLDAAVYVGDGNNPTAAAYYHADDAAGTIRNTAGVYLILPESRGYATRGLDIAASVDPLGASRSLGDNQADAMQRITGDFEIRNFEATFSFVQNLNGAFTVSNNTGSSQNTAANSGSNQANDVVTFNSANSVVPNTAKTDDDETRMVNRSTQFAIRY